MQEIVRKTAFTSLSRKDTESKNKTYNVKCKWTQIKNREVSKKKVKVPGARKANWLENYVFNGHWSRQGHSKTNTAVKIILDQNYKTARSISRLFLPSQIRTRSFEWNHILKFCLIFRVLNLFSVFQWSYTIIKLLFY